MRSNRRRNWLIKRIALGFAVAAIAAPVAQAGVDQGTGVPVAQDGNLIVQAHTYQPTSATDNTMNKIELVRVEQPRSTGSDIVAADYGMPRAMPNDYTLSRGDQIEVVRALPRGSSSDKIEFVRTQPRSTSSPELFGRYAGPDSTTASWNINWEDAGIGAGLALALILLSGGAVLASRHVGRAQTA